MKTLKSALHHWWPRSLSKLWVDNDGRVTRLAWDGTTTRSNPANFGAIKNAHHMKFGESNPWNNSFEEIFADADGQFSNLSKWLLSLSTRQTPDNSPLASRLMGHSLPDSQRSRLASTLASLIVRSPRSRNNIKLTVGHYRKAFGLAPDVDKTLIAGNMRGCQEVFENSIRSGGKFVVLVSREREFIFGDGFLHNFPAQANPPFLPRFVIPLLPTIAVLYARPSSYMREPEVAALNVTKEEARLLNDIVQVYSKDSVFYRRQEPLRTEPFRSRQFLQLEYDKHPWIENLIATVARFGTAA
jgi:hypothetical protein